MAPKSLFHVLIGSALVALLIPFGLIALILTYNPDTPPSPDAATEKVDSGTQDDSAEGAQDLDADENTDPDLTATRSDGQSNPNDGGPAKKPLDGPRYVIENPGDDPEIRKRAPDQEFDRFIAAAYDDLWNFASARADKDVPDEDRYCWNLQTAPVASRSLAREELQGLLNSDRFVGFPKSCPPRPRNP